MDGIGAEKRQQRGSHDVGLESNGLVLKLAEVRLERPEHRPELVLLSWFRLGTFQLVWGSELWQRRNVGRASW